MTANSGVSLSKSASWRRCLRPGSGRRIVACLGASSSGRFAECNGSRENHSHQTGSRALHGSGSGGAKPRSIKSGRAASRQRDGHHESPLALGVCQLFSFRRTKTRQDVGQEVSELSQSRPVITGNTFGKRER